MRVLKCLQFDPLEIVTRSQDIKLHSRVLNNTPGMGEFGASEQRKFLDRGGWLVT